MKADKIYSMYTSTMSLRAVHLLVRFKIQIAVSYRYKEDSNSINLNPLQCY